MKPNENSFQSLEERLVSLQQTTKNASISVEKIAKKLSLKGQPLILLFLSIPMCIPVQIPGMSTPFGVLIAFFGLRLAFGHRVWLPKIILNKTISPHTFQKIILKALTAVRKLNWITHPRMIQFCRSPITRLFNGLVVTLLGLLLALPMPIPVSNLVAAWPIFFLSFGLLQDDGLFLIIFYFTSLLAFAFFFALFWSIWVIV